MRSSRPAWWLLYALFPLAVVLLVAAHLASPSVGWRAIAEGTASLGVMGAMALWVRANRVALSSGDDQEDSENETPDIQDRAWLDSVDINSLRQEVDSHQDIFPARQKGTGAIFLRHSADQIPPHS